MRLLRYFAVSFSLYSRIPMPRFSWKEEDTKHSLMFFPFVGVMIGALILLLNLPDAMQRLPLAVRVLLTIAIPLLITGGIHIDGYMDTEDALRSFAPRERKLEILKDPHIGAFAVIGLVRVLLIFGASVILILKNAVKDPSGLWIFAGVFVTGRCLSGLTSLLFPKAKKEGMLYDSTRDRPKSVLVVLILELLAVSVLLLLADPKKGIPVLLSFALCTVIYRAQSLREFGGVSGDTAGRFLVSSETVGAVVLAVCTWIFG